MPPRKRKLLSSTRPPLLASTNPPGRSTLSSQSTRTLIRAHHTLQKQLSRALGANDAALAASLRAQIDAAGGLPEYQRASIQGQSSERGGDSSKVLVGWIEEERQKRQPASTGTIFTEASRNTEAAKPRLLEVGALRPDNACARSGLFDLTRIDLHSQHEAIAEQDFMLRLVPATAEELERDGFDVVSLSLVLNYVGEAVGRGELLRRVGEFLRLRRGGEEGNVEVDGNEEEEEWKGLEGNTWNDGRGGEDVWERVFLPGLFLVLPAPCVENSRYLDRGRMREILAALGYEVVREKMSSKLVYYYCVYRGVSEGEKSRVFSKTELRKGKDRNNFAIIIR